MFLWNLSSSIFSFASLKSKLCPAYCHYPVFSLIKNMCMSKPYISRQGSMPAGWRLETSSCKRTAGLGRQWNPSKNPRGYRLSVSLLLCFQVASAQLPTFPARRLLLEQHISFSFQEFYNSEACNILQTQGRFRSVPFSPQPVLLSRCRLLCVFNAFTRDSPNSLIRR